MNEWIDIIGYEGLYKINKIGDVYSVRLGRLIKPSISNKGYKYVDLYKNNKRERFLIHRLVALHFVPNPNKYPIVLHKDNIKLNTDSDNLKWGTYSENNAQAIRDGLNTIPRPDVTKNYRIYNEDDEIVCNSVATVKKITQASSTSNVRNYIHRKQALTFGPYRGYNIVPLIKPFKYKIKPFDIQDKRSTIGL